MRLLRLFALLAVTSTCASVTAPRPRTVPSGDLFCDRDADCVIVGDDVVSEGCCHNGTEPFAISRAAEERHRARRDIGCGHMSCTMECQEIRVTSTEDWVAVCSRHECRRSAKKPFPSPGPSCR